MPATLSGDASVVQFVVRTGFAAFPNVRALSLVDVSGDGTEYSLNLELESDHPEKALRLKMRFGGVRDLRLAHFGNRPTRVTGLDVLDVSSSQLEGVTFRVVDFENDMIRFVCRDAAIVSLNESATTG